jgi:hypothetical protein
MATFLTLHTYLLYGEAGTEIPRPQVSLLGWIFDESDFWSRLTHKFFWLIFT